VKAKATSRMVNIADDSVALAMKHIFSQLELSELDVADGLKELLYEKKYNLDSLLQSDAASVSGKLGIDEYVATIRMYTFDIFKKWRI